MIQSLRGIKVTKINDDFNLDLDSIKNTHPDLLELAKKYDKDGYVIINLDLDEKFCNLIKESVLNHINSNSVKKNPDIYHYNKYPRVIEGWKFSDQIKEVSLNSKVLSLLEIFYKSKPLPFSTINFIKGTEQPMHSDYIHFGSKPELYLAGAWVALEDIHPDSGPLGIVKKSHKSPIILFEDLGFEQFPKNLKEVKYFYTAYEEYLKEYIESNNLIIEYPLLKKGDCLIWQANLFHGACEIKNSDLTRWAQVTHYHFDKCRFFYNPNFSSKKRDFYSKRDVNISLID